MKVVELRDVAFSYRDKREVVLDGVTFSVDEGEIVGILGSSGSGKSTLLRLIAGLELPGRGSIHISGQCVVSDNCFVQPEKRGVSMVFQDYALFPHLTVRQNILFALHRLPRRERKRRLAEMLELVQMTAYADRYPHELSGGQQQRVALARALAPQPKVLLMDEPFSNLDADLRAVIRGELRDILKRAQMTCLFVTHDEADVKAICDRCLRMWEIQGVRL